MGKRRWVGAGERGSRGGAGRPGRGLVTSGCGRAEPQERKEGVSQAQGGRPQGWLGIEQDEPRPTGSILACPFHPHSHIIYWTHPVYLTPGRVVCSVERRGHHLLFEQLLRARSRAGQLNNFARQPLSGPTWLKRKLRLRGVK